MADNSTSKSLTYANNQVSRFNPNFIQTATVMDNRDPTHSGKLKVWINNSQSDPDAKGSWLVCRYVSIFAGRTPGMTSAGTYQEFPKSYGFWGVPPDVGAQVVVFFGNGNIHDAYWFGGIMDERMNTMVPGSATQVLADSGYDMEVPITDYDRNSVTSVMEQKYINIPLVEGLKKQNLLYDKNLGVPNRSSTRQTVSTVYGMSTPRGNNFILDDGYLDEELTAPTWDDDPEGYQDTQTNNPANDTRVGSRKNEGIVLRTRSGAQFLLSESEGNVFIINRDGTARIEMTPDGQINVHSDKSMTFRTDEDLNFLAKRDINMEAGANYNVKVNGNTKLELTGNLDAKVSGQVVFNGGSDIRFVSGASMRIQAGSSMNLSSGAETAIQASSTLNLSGSSVNITGGGTNLTVSNGVSSDGEMAASDFKSGNVGLNSHTHVHASFVDASNHSNEMAPPIGGGGSGSVSPAQPAQPANDVSPVVPVQTEQEAVQYVNSTEEVSQSLSQDLMIDDGSGVTYTQSIEGLGMLMPCTGTIREFGYWGPKVPDDKGKIVTRNGWIIQCKGEVVSPDEGIATKMSSGGFIITHRNGYKSIFYDLNFSILNKASIDKGQVIGTANGIFFFEIRIQQSNIFGFSGTVDPGLFYSSVSGEGPACANKSLVQGKPSNPNARPPQSVSNSVNSTDLVTMNNVKTIGSGYSQRGSRHVPQRAQSAKKKKTNSPSNAPVPAEDLSSLDRTAIDWKVSATDSTLINEVKEFEGSISFQTTKGSFRNGKFWTYKDHLGYPTIGYGHLLRPKESFRDGLDEPAAEQLLSSDLVRTVANAQSIYAKYKMKTPYIVQIVLTEMVFQMGMGGVLAFKNMLSALAAGNYKKAAAEIRSSLWYRQTTRRAEVMARRIESCE